MNIYDDLTCLIGNTPLIYLNKYKGALNLNTNIIAKLEYFNPLGSVKDRVALSMIKNAEKEGKLTKDSVIIEPTSGNTGIGLAFVGACRGYRVILTMPETMSVERQRLLKALGAEIILTDGDLGMTGAINKAKELCESTHGAYMPQQFENESNPKTHEETTALEILRDTDGKIDIIVAGVGTGGTITGIGRVLKKQKPNIKIVAVEPYSSSVLSGNEAGKHKIQGIGAGFIPKIFDDSVVDEIIRVHDEDAFKASRRVASLEGLLVGISSGAVLHAMSEISKQKDNFGKSALGILADSGERYLSTQLYNY